MTRGVRYIDEKLSKADKLIFLKLSSTYRYRKMHQIWSDKYMKSQSIRNSISANFHPKKARQISSSCLVTMMSSTDSILVREIFKNEDRDFLHPGTRNPRT